MPHNPETEPTPEEAHEVEAAPHPDFTANPLPGREIRLTPGTLAWLFATALGVILVLAALRELVSIILLVFLAITVALGIMPTVNRLEGFRIPRVLAVLSVYVAVLGTLGLLLFFIIQPFTDEVRQLVTNAPDIARDLYSKLPPVLQAPVKPFLDVTGVLSATSSLTTTTTTSGTTSITDVLGKVDVGAVLKAITGFVGGVATIVIGFVSVVVIGFYWVMLRDKPQQIFLSVIPPTSRDYASSVLTELANKIGGYVRGELLLGLIIGVLSYIGLLILGVDYALLLAVVAAITELIPTVGPVLGAVPAIIVAFATGGIELGLKVLILYVIIQQAENNIIVPRVMGSAVDLPPILVLVAVLIWGSLFGLLGAILAVPITAVLSVLFNRVVLPYLQQRAEESG
jgi:predicted PurR-regulated permease PerM